jgi:hypothetical protein
LPRSSQEDFKEIYFVFFEPYYISTCLRSLSNFWKFKRNENQEKQPHSAGSTFRPLARHCWPGRPKPTTWCAGAVTTSGSRTWWHAHWRCCGGRPSTSSFRRALGLIRGGIGHDEVGKNSPWYPVVGEVEKGIGQRRWVVVAALR